MTIKGATRSLLLLFFCNPAVYFAIMFLDFQHFRLNFKHFKVKLNDFNFNLTFLIKLSIFKAFWPNNGAPVDLYFNLLNK